MYIKVSQVNTEIFWSDNFLYDNTNRVLNIVKAKYELKDKGEAINFVVNKFIEIEEEQSLRSDFIEKMKKIEKQKNIHVDDFSKRYSIR